MKRKLCRMRRGRNASARPRRRSSGQIYRAVTIPHAIKLNAILTKNQIICCGTMKVSFLEFQPLICGLTSLNRQRLRKASVAQLDHAPPTPDRAGAAGGATENAAGSS